jgi:hypothetical protein
MLSLTDEEIQISKFISNTYAEERKHAFLPTSADWLKSKQRVDGFASNDPNGKQLWRIHDDLYDLSNFNHPGGPSFIELTKNTDITELFESSHPNIEKARALLGKYKVDLSSVSSGNKGEKVKDSKLGLRNTSRLTFEANGFYCTLRRKVNDFLLKEVPALSKSLNYWETTNAMLDSLLVGHLVFQFLAYLPIFPKWMSYMFVAVSGFCLAGLANCAHNYWHLRDNWRMYTFDLSCYSSYEWRISHGYSHHTFPNSVLDYEIWAFEPMIYFMSFEKKKKIPSFLVILLIIVVFPIGMILGVSLF